MAHGLRFDDKKLPTSTMIVSSFTFFLGERLSIQGLEALTRSASHGSGTADNLLTAPTYAN